MAEIHVQAKKPQANTSWVWIVLVVLIAAALIYFLTRDKDATDDNRTVAPANTTSYLQSPAVMWQAA